MCVIHELGKSFVPEGNELCLNKNMNMKYEPILSQWATCVKYTPIPEIGQSTVSEGNGLRLNKKT